MLMMELEICRGIYIIHFDGMLEVVDFKNWILWLCMKALNIFDIQ